MASDPPRGIGFRLAYLRDVAFPAFAGEDRAFIAHEPANVSALGCSEAVGFRPIGSVLEEDLPMTLLRLGRTNIIDA